MNSLLTALALVLAISISLLVPEYGATAVVVAAVLAIALGLLISQTKYDKQFLMRIFIGGLLVRVVIGTIIFFFQLQDFFGGDALTYDFFGFAQMKVWEGDRYFQVFVDQFMGGKGLGSGWGMVYLVALIYGIVGRNMLAIQLVNSVIGAVTAPVIYFCALHLFGNLKVARITAYFTAFFPSLVLWSSQGLKDGPIIFLLSLSMLATLKLGQKFDARYLLLLVGALFGVLSMRFYIFYMLVVAIGAAFILGARSFSSESFVRQFIIVVTLGLALTFLGVGRYASGQFETYGSLKQVQRSREDAATSAQSGFAEDVDVSTTGGVISTIPLGLVYLIFAPFPWQLASVRQSITLPEMVIWWTSFPLLILGLWYTIKFRLRQAAPVLIFTAMLTVAYSVFQGNIGTAYRQRAQLLVFYFIFVAVGFVILKERKEERKRQDLAARQAEAAPGTAGGAAAPATTTATPLRQHPASNI